MFNMGVEMEMVLRKYGNSTVVVLPPAVLKDLALTSGQHMSLNTTPSGQIVLEGKQRYTLADMLQQCDFNAAPLADMGAWDNVKPIGGEVRCGDGGISQRRHCASAV